ncbi:DUF2255 family protein [Planctomonas sp. JC2975]|uniref:DUF2255 family protein n=1 Tax=Planctomonas sp. JC2975 TaxID=2729626 RepID=UPI001475B19B|nr:DUF2255 family protein [Planctomonas sp. JC2975]NNC12521.1 DUF2255 family protein [Planctomonas sp. JC2975]
MSAEWTRTDLNAIDRNDEVGISSYRSDGTLRPYVTIWAVEADGHVYVRSAYGATNPWYRRALASGRGSIRVAGVAHDIDFVRADATEEPAVDDGYRAKYGARYASIVAGIVGDSAHDVTLRLEPSAA